MNNVCIYMRYICRDIYVRYIWWDIYDEIYMWDIYVVATKFKLI